MELEHIRESLEGPIILDHLTDYYEGYKAFQTFFGLVIDISR